MTEFRSVEFFLVKLKEKNNPRKTIYQRNFEVFGEAAYLL